MDLGLARQGCGRHRRLARHRQGHRAISARRRLRGRNLRAQRRAAQRGRRANSPGQDARVHRRADRRDRSKPPCGEFVAKAHEAFGRIDILVNNAGTHIRGTVETTTPGDFGPAVARQGVRLLRDDPGGAADHEAAARRAHRQHRRTGGAPSASGSLSIRRDQCGRDGDDQIGRRRGRARQHPRQRGVPAIHRVRPARLADRKGDARAQCRPRDRVGRLHARQSARAHRHAGGGRRPRRVSGVGSRRISPPAARSASMAVITATSSVEARAWISDLRARSR